MSSSYHGNTSSSVNNDTLIEMSTSLIENVNDRPSNIMVQSLDPTILSSPPSRVSECNTRSLIAQMNDQQARQANPLASASKMVPVPESLMSPDCPPAANVPPKAMSTSLTAPNNKISALKSTKGKCQSGIETTQPTTKLFPFSESKLVSPKSVSRPSLPKKTQEKSHEKSPVLNVRKNNTINAALKANLHADQQARLRNANHAGSPPPPQQLHSATPEHATDASSDDDSDHINVDKLKKIRSKAAQK